MSDVMALIIYLIVTGILILALAYYENKKGTRDAFGSVVGIIGCILWPVSIPVLLFMFLIKLIYSVGKYLSGNK